MLFLSHIVHIQSIPKPCHFYLLKSFGIYSVLNIPLVSTVIQATVVHM